VTLLLVLAALQPAFETTVEMTNPESGIARTVVRGASRGYQALRWTGAWQLEALPANESGAFESAVVPGPDGWFRIPVPIPATSAGALDFAATIHPPPGYRIQDPFPTRVEAEGAGVRMSLPAPPSFLRFRLAPADARFPGLTALVDIAALAVFLGLALFGAFRLIRT